MAESIFNSNKKDRYNLLNEESEVSMASQEELDNVKGRVLYNE